ASAPALVGCHQVAPLREILFVEVGVGALGQEDRDPHPGALEEIQPDGMEAEPARDDHPIGVPLEGIGHDLPTGEVADLLNVAGTRLIRVEELRKRLDAFAKAPVEDLNARDTPE